MPEHLENDGLSEIISMIQCAYCGEQWVREDTELVCPDCEPSLNVDLCVAGLVNDVNELEHLNSEELVKRLDLLINTSNKLASIIKKIKPRTKE